MSQRRRRAHRGRVSVALGLVAALGALMWMSGPVGAEQASSQARTQQGGHIATGLAHSCVVLETGHVRCWGFGAQGQLGYGDTGSVGDTDTTLPSSVGPVDLGSGRTAIAISAGGAHTCAILDNGRVRCWGSGTNGQLGYGNTESIGDDESPGSVGPVDLGHGRTAIALSTSQDHTCASLDSGQVRCWGSGSEGRLGYGDSASIGDDEVPATVAPVDIGGVMLRRVAGLSLSASVSTPEAQVGEQLAITVHLANAGPDAAAVAVAAPPAPGLSVLSASTANGSYAIPSATWNTGTLSAGSQATLQLLARPIAPGSLTTTARIVASDARDPRAAFDNLFPGPGAQAQVTLVVPEPAPRIAQIPVPGPAIEVPVPGPIIEVSVPGPVVHVAPPVRRVAADRLGLVVAPRMVRPTTLLRVAGTLVISRAAPRPACRGPVVVQVRAGPRLVAQRRVALRYVRDACRLTAAVRLPPVPRLGGVRVLRVSARFAGNPLLLSRASRPVAVRVRR